MNEETRFPTGSSTALPSSNINLSVTMSIMLFPSGTSMSLTCNNADDTSFTETPENLSFIFFVMLFCTIVTYFPAIVKYAEFIFISASLSAS